MKTTIYYSTIILFTVLAIISSCNKDRNEPITGEIDGNVTNFSECKNKSAILHSEYSSSESCITYSYDAQTNVLTLKHINTGFNCCPEELYCETELLGDTIIIKEFEKAALCKCNCLFDMDIEITSVAAKNYILKIVEPYYGEQDQLIISVDLESNPTGEFCVDRDIYPWGI